MEEGRSTEAVELPLACRLGPQDGAERMRRWRALAERAQPSARRSGHELEASFQAGPGVREELEALAADERECCSFVSWEVVEADDAGQVVLRVSAKPGSPEDVTPIAALFGAE